jgi:butyrate kinase
MAKTFNEKIAAINLEMEQLENRKKQIIGQQKEADRKARTNRLCRRGGFLESILPGTIPLTDGQFETFLKKTMLTDFSRRALAAIGAENAEPAADNCSDATARSNTAPAPKPAGAAQSGNTDDNANGANGARATN